MVASEPINWKGNWNSTVSYAATDAVSYSGKSWIVGVGPTTAGVTPDTANSGWVLLCNEPQPVILPATNSVTFHCGNSQCSLTNYDLVATCPSGYNRLTLVSCTKPNSPTLSATEYLDPYQDNQLGCAYNGTYPPFSTESLTVDILCVQSLF